MYHDVSDRSSSRPFRKFVVSPSLFNEHLSALAGAGFQTERASALADPGSLRASPAVVLTFDDGFASFSDFALPELVRFDMTATVFVPTASIGDRSRWLRPLGEGGRRILDWIGLKDALDQGIEIGAHGHRHVELDVLDPQELDHDLSECRSLLQDGLGTDITSLAYPYGYHHRSVRSAARRAGFQTACAVGYGMHETSADPMCIRRFLIGPDTSAEDLLGIVEVGRTTLAESVRIGSRPVWRTVRRCRRALARRT